MITLLRLFVYRPTIIFFATTIILLIWNAILYYIFNISDESNLTICTIASPWMLLSTYVLFNNFKFSRSIGKYTNNGFTRKELLKFFFISEIISFSQLALIQQLALHLKFIHEASPALHEILKFFFVGYLVLLYSKFFKSLPAKKLPYIEYSRKDLKQSIYVLFLIFLIYYFFREEWFSSYYMYSSVFLVVSASLQIKIEDLFSLKKCYFGYKKTPTLFLISLTLFFVATSYQLLSFQTDTLSKKRETLNNLTILLGKPNKKEIRSLLSAYDYSSNTYLFHLAEQELSIPETKKMFSKDNICSFLSYSQKKISETDIDYIREIILKEKHFELECFLRSAYEYFRRHESSQKYKIKLLSSNNVTDQFIGVFLLRRDLNHKDLPQYIQKNNINLAPIIIKNLDLDFKKRVPAKESK